MGLPKLRVKLPSDHEAQDVYSVEEARYRFNWGRDPFLMVVEGQDVSSFEELVDLAGRTVSRAGSFLRSRSSPCWQGDRDPCLAHGPGSLDSAKRKRIKENALIFHSDSHPTLTADAKSQIYPKGGRFQ